MARALFIEEESGTCSGFLHPHNGYAGDFTQALVAQVPTPGWGLPAPQTGAAFSVTRLRGAVLQVDDHTHALPA
jgi:hypothetical protein